MYIYIFTVCVGKSTFVLLTLLISALGSLLSNRCCRCAGTVLPNGHTASVSGRFLTVAYTADLLADHALLSTWLYCTRS